MATSANPPQRAWRAACPNCGAPVDFASAASASAVCSFCRSTLVRDGDALQRIGISAELFDDHSPLQLGTRGTHQGVAFTLVGRLQYRYGEGRWNTWHALFDSARSGWLSEDNGRYVIAFDATLASAAPASAALRVGERLMVDGRTWDVASITPARWGAAQGELPRAPRLDGGEFIVADLRNERNEVGTLDWQSGAVPQWSVGQPVRLAELKLQGLRERDAKALAGRSLDCPSCGTSLQLTLGSTKSIACGYCKAVVDVSQGVGAGLAHYAQNNAGQDGAQPLIALGRTGRVALGGEVLPWQVVGYVERCDLPAEGDERVYWREYLVYNVNEGFAFLVDAEDGWSWVRPLTGAPTLQDDMAQWAGLAYQKRYAYHAKTTWVLGEFYWQLQREQRAYITDYFGRKKASGRRLSREQVGNEVTWSEGAGMERSVLEQAFGLEAGHLPDVTTFAGTSASAGGGLALNSSLLKVGLIVLFIAIPLLVSYCEERSDCSALRNTFGQSSNEYQQCARGSGSAGSSRTSGGSFGGFSSGGGGHK